MAKLLNDMMKLFQNENECKSFMEISLNVKKDSCDFYITENYKFDFENIIFYFYLLNKFNVPAKRQAKKILSKCTI